MSRAGPARLLPMGARAVLVELGSEEVLVDVGFGGPLPSASLSLVDGQEQIIRGESFLRQAER